MKEHDLCLYFETCEHAEVCLRCLIPIKHSEEKGVPCCYRMEKNDENRNTSGNTR